MKNQFDKSDIKTGDLVKILPAWKWMAGVICKVTKVRKCNPKNPIEEHGIIELKIVDPRKTTYQKGDLEHFAHYNWSQYLKIISE